MPDKYIIISASRMTDLAAYYPEALIYEVKERIKKGLKIHTLVLWTKHIQSLFCNPLNAFLQELKATDTQIFVHLTVTGLAGVIAGNDLTRKPVILEPNVPSTQVSLNYLPDLIELTGNADRIRLRIDPIVKIKDSYGNMFSNLEYFESIVNFSVIKGINHFTFSFLENGMHRKVDKRFSDKGLIILSPKSDERIQIFKQMTMWEEKYKITLSACCVPGLKTSRCIDGYLLEKLHNLQIPVSKKEPHSRPLCGCTESIDIGGWPPKICHSGCLYCYSRPSK
jgi:hypothetical protein